MKKMILAVCLTVLPLIGAVIAGETNIVYLPIDLRASVGGQIRAKADAQWADAAKNRPECRPAELDPDGHWGQVQDGLQLSIRFPTNVFVSRQPINATVTLRNVTTNSILLLSTGAWTIDFLALDEKQKALSPANRALWYTYSGSANVSLPGRRQIAYPFRLNDIFDLSRPGRYYVSAKRLTDKRRTIPEIHSGVAEITIIGMPTK